MDFQFECCFKIFFIVISFPLHFERKLHPGCTIGITSKWADKRFWDKKLIEII